MVQHVVRKDIKFNLLNPLKERVLKKFLICVLVTILLNLSFFFSLSCLGVCQNSPTIEVLFSPEQGEEILRTLTDTIQNAEERVYILIFSFTLDEIAEAIIKKHREGLDVKVIMDKGQAGSRWAVTEKLKQAGVPLVVKPGSKGGYMHIKALIADDTVLTGSYNYSKSATNRNDENFLVIKDSDVLQAHLARFNRLWGEKIPAIYPEIKKEQERAPPCEIIVYITKTGRKYHQSGCGYVRQSCIPISLIEAIQQGYAPCKVCNPPSVADYHVKARILYQQGEFLAAVKCFNRAIEFNPHSARYHNDRGMSYSKLRQFDKAIADFNQAMELWPGFAEAYYNRGVIHFELGRYDEALRDFRQAKYLFPNEQDKSKAEKLIQEIRAKSQSDTSKRKDAHRGS